MILTHSLRQSEKPRSRPFRFGRKRKKRPPLIHELNKQPVVRSAHQDGFLLTGLVVGGLGLSAVGLLVASGGAPMQTLRQLIMFAQGNPYAPLIYGTGAVILPNLFMSQTALTITAGLLFGPVVGIALSVTTQTISSLIAYGIGQQLGQRTKFGNGIVERVDPYVGRLRRNPFEGTVLLRLLFLPEEAVSYASGILDIGWKPFITGTMLGILPSTVFFVQVGNAISNGVLGSLSYFNPTLLIASGTVLAGTLIVAKLSHEQEVVLESDPDDIIEGEIIPDMGTVV